MERKQQELTDEDRGKLFALLSVHSKATTFAGNIYEPYVHKVLRTPGSISSSPLDLPPMQPMTYRPRTCVKCGSKSSACPHTTDCVHETTTEQYSVYDDFFKGQRDYEYAKLPDWTQLDLDCYYRPVQPDNPFFDSFILRNGGSYIVAAFIQISIPRGRGHTHTTTSAVTTITEVRENACRRFHKPVEIIYIYVAPDVLPTAKYPLRWTVDKVYLTQPVVSDAKVNEVQRVFYLGVPLPHNATQVANARHALSVRARSQNAMIYPDVKTLHEGNRGTKEPANKVRRTTETDAPSSHTATSNAGGRVGRKVRDKRK
ncbi:hypothetical protein EV359DRAFT_79196 [Lentinula novae-zelandiae]|nr:hypothetical protein EV359DRAFT_79196 [Lentinula novae-zelandiae]